MAQASAFQLAYANLFQVTNNRDSVSRRATMNHIYHDNVTVHEPDGTTLHGCAEMDNQVQKLLDEREYWEFQAKGNVKICHNLVYLAWAFGPRDVQPVLTGAHHFFVIDGKIKEIYVIIDGISDLSEPQGKEKELSSRGN
jgi:hypothetical protein